MRIAVLLVVMCLAGAAGAAPPGDRVADAASGARGDLIYHTLCWTCHGKYGRGDGPLSSSLKTPPVDLTRSALLLGNAEVLLAKIRPNADPDRHTPMILGRAFTDQALRDVVAYIQNEFPDSEGASVSAGRDLYNTICWTCHGVNGDGNGPQRDHIKGSIPRDFTSPTFVVEEREEEIYRIISAGAEEAIHGSKYMKGWGANFSPQRWRSVGFATGLREALRGNFRNRLRNPHSFRSGTFGAFAIGRDTANANNPGSPEQRAKACHGRLC